MISIVLGKIFSSRGVYVVEIDLDLGIERSAKEQRTLHLKTPFHRIRFGFWSVVFHIDHITASGILLWIISIRFVLY